MTARARAAGALTVLAAAALAGAGALAGCGGGEPAGRAPATAAAAGPAARSAPPRPAPTPPRRAVGSPAEPLSTVADYLAGAGAAQVPLLPDPAGPPLAAFTPPDGWLPADVAGAYAAARRGTPSPGGPAPEAVLLVSRVDGPADPAGLLAHASFEVRNLRGFTEYRSDNARVAGHPAVLVVGGYADRDLGPMVVSQRAVAVTAGGALYLVRLTVLVPQSLAETVDEDVRLLDESLTVGG